MDASDTGDVAVLPKIGVVVDGGYIIGEVKASYCGAYCLAAPDDSGLSWPCLGAMCRTLLGARLPRGLRKCQ